MFAAAKWRLLQKVSRRHTDVTLTSLRWVGDWGRARMGHWGGELTHRGLCPTPKVVYC